MEVVYLADIIDAFLTTNDLAKNEIIVDLDTEKE
mgnify:CR=1 FL=1